MIKICQECGKEFDATNGMQKFCSNVHYRSCSICGAKFEVTRYHLTAKDAKTTCSKKCSIELRKRTNQDKYGGVAPACSESVRTKMEATNQELYGVKHAAQAQEFKDKARETALIRYGEIHYARTQKAKQEQSARWRNEQYKNKVKESQRATSLERYGTEFPMQAFSVKSKFIESHMTDSSKLEEFVKFKEDTRHYIMSLGLDHKPTLWELTSYVGVNESTVGVYVHANKCEDLIDVKISVMEQEVCTYLRSICPNICICNNDRSIITPYEIDIYLPEYKLGIECNPTATHNATLNVFDRDAVPLPSNYHKMKTNLCESKDVRLIHIFGHEWTSNRSVIESILKNAIHQNDHTIYARKCVVKDVDSRTAGQFLTRNHRQRKTGSSVRLGLYYNDELVSLMTFGKMRNSIGTGNSDLSSCYELIRFCSAINTTVVGGASKLFKYFVSMYQPTHIRSFSDRAHTTGNLYNQLGFKEVSRSSAGYMWVNLKTDQAYHRINAQKQNLKKFLSDENIDLSKTEREIMMEHGYVQVFDSGTITWEWKPSLI